jgi:drug/metabolite transporter (DMT)-like permease
MQRFVVGNVYLLLSMVSAVSSQILLKALIDELQPLISGLRELPGAFDGPRSMRLAASLALLVAGYGFWVLSLTRLNLSYAYPIACCSVLVAVLLSVLFLGESVSPRQWIGTVLLLTGAVLLMPTQG